MERSFVSPRHVRRASPSSSPGRSSRFLSPLPSRTQARPVGRAPTGALGPALRTRPCRPRASHPHQAGAARAPAACISTHGLPVAPLTSAPPTPHRPPSRATPAPPCAPACPCIPSRASRGRGGGASPPGVPTLPQEGPGPRPADASTHLRAARRVLAAHALGQRGGGGLGAVPLAACAMNEAVVQPPLCARRGPAPLQERKATPPVPPTQDWPLRGGRVERSWGDCVGDPGPCRGSLGWAAHCSAGSALSLALIAPIPSPVGAETDGDLGTNSGAQGPPLRDSGPGIPQCWVFWSPRSKCPDPQGISGGRRRTGQRTLRSARSDGLASALRLGLP